MTNYRAFVKLTSEFSFPVSAENEQDARKAIKQTLFFDGTELAAITYKDFAIEKVELDTLPAFDLS